FRSNNVAKLGEINDNKVPTKYVIIAPMYIVRVLNLLIIHAEIGIITPLTNIKPVVNHSTVAVLMSNDFISAGNAVASKVAFKIVQKEPIIKTRTNKDR